MDSMPPQQHRKPGKGLSLIPALLLTCAATCAQADLTQAQVEHGKRATALVQVTAAKSPSARTGTSFCIDGAGWFITCGHVTNRAADGKVRLILNTGEKDQKSVEAKVVRTDAEKDLALLKVTEAGSFTALSMGKVEGLVETMRVTAFGYPFGPAMALAEGAEPAISVSTGAITSLRKKEGRLEVIQLDASLNPGNSGGPILDPEGRVIGIANAGIRGAALNFAIPVNQLQAFLSEPEVEFTAPSLNAESMGQPASFRAKVLSVFGATGEYQVELTLTVGGDKRKVTMKREGDGYAAQEVPVPPRSGPVYVSMSATYGKGTVTGLVADDAFTVGEKRCQLSKVSSLEGGPKPKVVLDDGTTLNGPITGLSSVTVVLDETQLTLDLAKAASVSLRPLETPQAVTYELAVRNGDTTLKKIDGVIAIALPTAIRTASTGNPSGGTDNKIMPARLDAEQIELKLPADIADVAVGGGGRYLILHLRKLRQLAIFDANAARIVKYLAVDSDDIVYAAGAEKLMVVSVAKNLISRYNLGTFEREVTAPMPLNGVIKSVALGSNCLGPMLVHVSQGTDALSSTAYHFLAPNTLALINTPIKSSGHYSSYRDMVHVRPSADGTVFGMWATSHSPSGLQTMVLEGKEAKTYYEHDSAGSVIPGPDGRVIYTSSGLYTVELKLIGRPEADGRGNYRIPAQQGNYYLEVGNDGKMAVCISGESRALITLPKLIDREDLQSSANAFFTPDKRFHFIPDAQLIVAIPKANDRLILRRFDIMQMMKEASIDYLFVASSPVTSAAPGSAYTYPIRVESKRGGVKYSLESAPEGMKISPSGNLTWLAGAAASEPTVIVRITDASGQELFHSFKISIK